jgi:hypothetical protein
MTRRSRELSNEDVAMRWRAWAMAAAISGAGLACDDKPDIPPEAVEAHRAESNPLPASKPAPTTQELLTGAKTKFRLGDIPLTLDVPKDWGLKSEGEGSAITIRLEGPATSGTIAIQLSAQLNPNNQPITNARIEQILAETKREANAKPHPINRVELRNVGPLKVLEHRMISSKDFTGGKLPPEVWGETMIKNEKTGETKMVRTVLNPVLVKWNFTVFVPGAPEKYNARSLTFIGLGLSEFERDKEFLEQLMKSLKYEE